MRDGVYQVTQGGVCAGFVVEGGRVTDQAPILRAWGITGWIARVDTFQRVVVTGSRDYTDRAQVKRDLASLPARLGCRPDQVVVVGGMARGLDMIARSVAVELGMRVEDHPVTSGDWDRFGKSAGHRRNAVMVAGGARGVIAYPLGKSRGTRGCIELAEAAGIPVWIRGDRPGAPGSGTPDAVAGTLTRPVAVAPEPAHRAAAGEQLVDEGAGTLFECGEVPDTPGRRARLLAASEPTTQLPALVPRHGGARAVTLAEAHAALTTILGDNDGALTVDVETSGYPLGHIHYLLRTVQLGDDHTAIVFDATNSRHRGLIAGGLDQARFLIAYSATADLVPLVGAGLVRYDDAWDKMRDVMLAAKLADPHVTGTDAGLKSTAAAVLGDDAVSPAAEAGRAALFAAGGWLTDTRLTTPVHRCGWAQVNPQWTRMVQYAASDVLDTAALVHRLGHRDAAVLDRERVLQRMTARITHEGLPLDSAHVSRLVTEHLAARDTAAAAAGALGVSEPGSPRCVAAALTDAGVALPRTEAGNPTVEASVLKGLQASGSDTTGLVDAVLAYRNHTTLLSTFLVPYQQLCDHGDGRVRPTIYTLSARTGRMSCVRPNVQNVPRAGGIRACITADPDHLLVSADLAGIEMRVAAALSGDAALTKMVLGGRSEDKTDLHWLVAHQVFGPDATKADRYTVKPGVYGRFYGGGVPTLAAEMGCTEALAAAVVDTLDALTPDFTRWAGELRDQVKSGRTTYQLYTGAQLQLPEAFPHKAPNYVIQRTARELLVDALVRWRDTPWGDSVVLPIHDEIVAMVAAEDAVLAGATLVECMTREIGGVPVTAVGNPASFLWGDADSDSSVPAPARAELLAPARQRADPPGRARWAVAQVASQVAGDDRSAAEQQRAEQVTRWHTTDHDTAGRVGERPPARGPDVGVA